LKPRRFPLDIEERAHQRAREDSVVSVQEEKQVCGIPEPEQCWEAIRRGGRSYDGRFFYGVKTTGIYCRPSCPSRIPLRQNVIFFASARDAGRAGFRACLRCRPQLTPDNPLPAPAAIRLI